MTAFVTLEIPLGRWPGSRRRTARRDPGGAEAHVITGAGYRLCRVVARGNTDLQCVVDRIVSIKGVISLAAQVPYRILRLVRAASRPAPAGSPSPI